MNSFINYLIESGISLVVLTCIYWFFLRKETFFKANRLFLVSSVIFALVIPFLKFSFHVTPHLVQANNVAITQINLLQAVSVYSNSANQVAVNTISSWHIIAMIYCIGVLLFSTLFAIKLYQIYSLISKGDVEQKNGYTLVSIEEVGSPFSFMNYIFHNKELQNQSDYHKMIEHELEHVKQYHTIDILILEILIIFQWFNPFVWILKVIFRENHEFLADKAVLETGVKPVDYKILLLNQAIGLNLQLTNGFNQSLIKKRIKMMTKMKSKKITLVKYLSGIIAMSLLMLVFAFNQKSNANDKSSEEVLSLNKEKLLKNITKSHQMGKDSVYTIVEEKPQFVGGYKALLRYLSKNVKYPVSAQKKGIQGRVYVRFVIDKEGNVKDAKIARSVDPALDKEALRLVKSMPKWKPGKHKGNPVRVRYNMPVNFVLQ